MKTLEALSGLCCARGFTVATAESCTGGLIGSRITAMPGASAFYAGGWVCYDNALKARLLGVPETLLATKGAVSAETALAMAEGARRLLGVDAAVSVTGIAGPGGGTPEKPAGTVFIAVATAETTWVRHHRWKGGRTQVRNAACQAALRLVVKALSSLEAPAG